MPKFYCYRALLILLFVALTISIRAQETPPSYPSNIKINYVRTWVATAPEQNPATLTTRPLKDVKQTTVYSDGLGRTLQTVIKQGSLSGTDNVDMVSPVVYDAMGRETLKFMPFAARTTGGAIPNDGNFKTNPFQQQAEFGMTQYPGETYFYAKAEYEAAPLNRIKKTYASGNSWVGAGRGVETNFLINTAFDDVKIWIVTENTAGLATYTTTESYAPGTLFKNVYLDEDNKQVIEFLDKNNQLILKKAQFTAVSDDGSGKGHEGFLCTYYIYDDFNNLRCIIQPKGVEKISTLGWVLSDATILSEQCFQYKYDERNRQVIKKMPGTGEVRMVYDSRDRLVFTQDANMRSKGQWVATLYDELNRQVLTGHITYHDGHEQLQSLVSAQTSGTGSDGTPVPTSLSLSQPTSSASFYAFSFIELNPGFETGTDATVIIELIAPSSSGEGNSTTIEGVSVNANPLPSGSTFIPLIITYFDNYQWASGLNNSLKNFETGSITNHLQQTSSVNFPYAEAPIASTATTGLITGRKALVLGSQPAKYVTSVNFYDDKGRMTQIRSQNSTDGYDAVTTQYNWAGQPLTIVQQQQKAGANAQTHLLVTNTSYDQLGRLKTINKTVNSTIGGQLYNVPAKEIARLEYNAMGQLKQKVIGDNMETLDYDYNIRGWLLGLNREFIKDDAERFFGYELAYDKTAAIISGTSYDHAQYDGNISGSMWKSAGDNEKRKFDFSYDAVNRLTGAAFKQFAGSDFSRPNGINFSVENLSYDANGNIMTMQQRGWKLNKPGDLIDHLTYTYYENSNKLKNVVDVNNDVDSKLGDFRSSQLYLSVIGTKTNSATDYTYDPNGNLNKDLNKDIGTATTDGIVYNILNLPQTITLQKTGGVKGTIHYVYDALGNKLKKIVEEAGQETKTSLYLNGAVYMNDTLQYFGHEEGRLRFGKHYFVNGDSALEYNYDYFLKDHLGNVRMVLTEQKDTAKYIATMEPVYRGKEDSLFSNITATALPTPVFYPTDTDVTDPNQQVALLNGTAGKKIGPSIILKVMGGDQVDLFVKSFYQTTGGGENKLPTAEIVSSLANTFLGAIGPAKGSFAQLTDIASPVSGGVGLFRDQKQEELPGKPKAFLNWILFDEQFNYVSASSGASPVGAAGQLYPHTSGPVSISKNGYLYVYTSNETENWNVYFNDLIVEHKSGKIIEETHYYPFGLAMAGISSRASGRIKNKYKFNGGNELQSEEFSDGSGIELYDAQYRMYDPQIGRFNKVDPMAEFFDDLTPYNFAYNNPSLYNDPSGLFPEMMGPQDITGWIKRTDGTIYFDPNVHKQEDLGPNTDLIYLGERLKVTLPNGTPLWLDEKGNILGSDPYWGHLGEVTVTGKKSPNKNAGYYLDQTEHNYNGIKDVAEAGLAGLGTIKRGDMVDFFYDVNKSYKYHQGVNLLKPSVATNQVVNGIKGAGKLVKRLGPLGNALTAGNIIYEVSTDKWDAHSVIDGTILVGGAIVAGVCAAPVVAAVAIGVAIYGALDYFFDINDKVDALVGRKSELWK